MELDNLLNRPSIYQININFLLQFLNLSFWKKFHIFWSIYYKSSLLLPGGWEHLRSTHAQWLKSVAQLAIAVLVWQMMLHANSLSLYLKYLLSLTASNPYLRPDLIKQLYMIINRKKLASIWHIINKYRL